MSHHYSNLTMDDPVILPRSTTSRVKELLLAIAQGDEPDQNEAVETLMLLVSGTAKSDLARMLEPEAEEEEKPVRVQAPLHVVTRAAAGG